VASEEDFTLVVSINEYILRGDDVGTDRIHAFERGITRVYARFHATYVRGVSTWALTTPPQYVHRQTDSQCTCSVRAPHVH
jgi:hypothetical protein